MSTLARALVVLLPWPLRRLVLQWCFGYRLHPTSRIGLSWVFPRRLEMGPRARIGHLNVAKGMDLVVMGDSATIGRLNWITAFPSGTRSRHFSHRIDRAPELILGDHAAVTNRHLIDCTERVTIGRFTTVAGFRSQILTHSIDLHCSRQDAKPVTIGCYCFVGTACTILGGAALPDYSVLGAHALLNKAHGEPYRLYAGVPAAPVRALGPNLAYFSRVEGFVT